MSRWLDVGGGEEAFYGIKRNEKPRMSLEEFLND